MLAIVGQQATSAMMNALVKGDPDGANIVRESARQLTLGWRPGRGG